MIAVLTAIIGGYDNLRAPESPPEGMRFYCYTDEPRFDSGWLIQPLDRNGNHRKDSRLPKILSHLHTGGAEKSVWMDGCFRPRKVEQFLEQMGDADLVAIEHPRKDAFREADYCRREGYGNAERIDAQLAHYREEGWSGEPFVCGGILGRRENEAIRQFNELWWREYRAWQERDQFALGYAIWKSGIRVQVIRDIDILQNPWFSFHFHAWCHDLSDNPEFAETRRQMDARAMELRRLTA